MQATFVILLLAAAAACVGPPDAEDTPPPDRPAQGKGEQDTDPPERTPQTRAEEINRLVHQLAHESEPVRTAASEQLEAIGEPAVGALRGWLQSGATEAAKERARAVLFAIHWPTPGAVHDGLQMTIKTRKKVYRKGESIQVTVRLVNKTAADKTLRRDSEGQGSRGGGQERGIATWKDVVRLVVIDGKQKHQAIGFFWNLNRGPDRARFAVPARHDSTTATSALLGYKLAKGGDKSELLPGTYRVYAKLGDTLGGWSSAAAVELCSNEVEFAIR